MAGIGRAARLFWQVLSGNGSRPIGLYAAPGGPLHRALSLLVIE